MSTLKTEQHAVKTMLGSTPETMPSSAGCEYRLRALFSPASVAVVGASPDMGKPGGRALSFLRKYGYPGAVYPINPRYPTIGDLTCYPDLSSLPGPLDMAILLVPAAATPAYIEAAADAGASAAVICSSGFGEAGELGKQLQRDLIDSARRRQVAVLGPNCLGMIDLHNRLVASFSTALASDEPVTPGPIAFISQSGAMGVAVFTIAQSQGIEVGKFLSTGNEAVLDFTDFLDYLTDDPDVTVILGYVEGIRDGRRFIRAARRARAAGKRVGVLKVGRSEAGGRASQSHTGALAGAANIYDAAFRRAGVRTVGDIAGLIDLAVVAPSGQAAAGPGIGIVSMSGGAGVMIADACVAQGLRVAEFSSQTREILRKTLPEFAGIDNPVDYGAIYGDMDSVQACAMAVAEDSAVDITIVFIGMSPNLVGVIEERLAEVQRASGKPLLVAWLGGLDAGLRRLRALGVPSFEEPSRAVAAAAHLVYFSREPLGPDPDAAPARSSRAAVLRGRLRDYRDGGRTTLSEHEVKQIVETYGVPVGQEVLALTEEDARRAGQQIGRPLAVKAAAPQLLHKSDAGAVRLGVDPHDAAQAWREVVAAAAAVVGVDGVQGALVQPMAERGIEMLAGLRFDPQFGPTVTIALGGVASEVMADAVTELAPIDLALAHSMISRLRAAPLLGAFRGQAPHDVGALASLLVTLGDLALDAGDLLAELDLNPVIVHAVGLGCTVVDGAAVLGSSEDGGNPV